MRRFSEQEISLFDEVSAHDAQRARIAYARLMPPGVSGITFGPLIVIRHGISASARPDLYQHELIHVEQYRRYGTIRFIIGYLGDYVANLCRLRNHREAYLAIALEQEARERVRAWSDRQRSS